MIAESVRLNHLQSGQVSNMTTNEAFAKFYHEISTSEKNIKTIDYQLENILRGLGSVTCKDNNLSLHEIGRRDVAAYIQWRKAQPSKRGGMISPTSVNAEVRLLRRVLNKAPEDWDVNTDRNLSFKNIFLKEPHERSRSLKGYEEERLIEALHGHDLNPVVRFSLLSAQRQQSVMKLEWKDFDYQAMTVTFRDVKSKRQGKIHQLPLTSEMIAIVDPLRAHHSKFVFTYLCKRSSANPKRERGKRYPFSKTGWRKQWKKVLEAAGISDFRWHDLRHTSATFWVLKLGMAKAKQITGHADFQSLARYSRLDVEDIREDMEGKPQKIPKKQNVRLLGGGRTSQSYQDFNEE